MKDFFRELVLEEEGHVPSKTEIVFTKFFILVCWLDVISGFVLFVVFTLLYLYGDIWFSENSGLFSLYEDLHRIF